MLDRTARWAIYHLWPMPSNVPEGAVSHIDDGPNKGEGQFLKLIQA